jgi:UDP-perosamine 4-acetyltransferase
MQGYLLIIGGGGHAKVVIDLARRLGVWRIVGVLDDAPNLAGKMVLGCPVLGGTERLQEFAGGGVAFVVAIGANALRQRLQNMATAAGLLAVELVHPSAMVAESAVVGPGAVVMAGAVINAEAKIGEGVIVNTGALIDHDCCLGAYCHIAPGAALCGEVTVGARSLVGVGASVIPGVSIGDDCVVAAGAAVVRLVPSGSKVAGVPARPSFE